MFKKGEIVYHNNLVFSNNDVDKKKNRPCIILFELVLEGKEYVCTCPLTNQVRKFNKHPNKFIFLPDVIYNYHKFSFAPLNKFLLKPVSETNKEGIFVSEETANKLIEAILKTREEEYAFLRNYVALNKENLLPQQEKSKNGKTKKLIKKNK